MQIKFGGFLEVAVNCPPTPSDTTHTTNLELEDPIVENQAEEKSRVGSAVGYLEDEEEGKQDLSL